MKKESLTSQKAKYPQIFNTGIIGFILFASPAVIIVAILLVAAIINNFVTSLSNADMAWLFDPLNKYWGQIYLTLFGGMLISGMIIGFGEGEPEESDVIA